MEERSTGTASPPSSFVVKFEDGQSGLRHKSYLKHEVPADNSDPDSADSSTGPQPTTDGPVDIRTGSDASNTQPLCIPPPPGPANRLRARRERA